MAKRRITLGKKRILRSLRILHSMWDDRIHAQTTMVALSVGDYLRLTHESEENLSIQRRILPRNKIYDRLQKDLKTGGTIPPIVLAVAEEFDVTHDDDGSPTIASIRRLSSSFIYIVDGLQRTNHLREVAEQLSEDEEASQAFLSRDIRAEIWTKISFPSVLYRMMLLNAAQTPMSLRHQLEVVSLHIIKMIQGQDDSIEIFTENAGRKRVGPKQFKGSDLIEAFTAFVKRNPITEVKSLVVEEIDREDFIERFDSAKYNQDMEVFVRFLLDLDEAICEKYTEIPGADGDEQSKTVRKGTNFLGTKPYLLGVAAAAGDASSKLTEKEFRARTRRLVRHVRTGEADPLALETFNRILSGLLQSTGKIGDTQRQLVFTAFRTYLLDGEEDAFESYWKEAARRI